MIAFKTYKKYLVNQFSSSQSIYLHTSDSQSTIKQSIRHLLGSRSAVLEVKHTYVSDL